jgi:hypothetical protein
VGSPSHSESVTDTVGELETCRARQLVLERMVAILGEALAMVPASPMAAGQTWMPSDESLAVIRAAKDVYADFGA